MLALSRYEFNAKEFAAICGVTVITLTNWVEEGMPKPEKPSRNASYFDLKVHLPWVIENKWKPNQSARARKQEADASIAEMVRDEKAGSLVPVAAVTREYTDFLTRLRSNLMGFGDRLIPLLAETTNPREQLAIARREMGQTLREIVAEQTEVEPKVTME